jgi:5-methylcytosine-specific restriction endonuclease McrA
VKRRCLDCNALTTGSRCDVHRRAHARQKERRRPTPAQRGYNASWRRLRVEVLERDGWRCAYCGRPAEAVDHVVPASRGGDFYDPDNLVAACRSCNSRKGDR